MFILELFLLLLEGSNKVENFIENKYTKECIIKETKYINGYSMEPLLKNKIKVILTKGYYKCNKEKPKKGDIIGFIHAKNPMPFIKMVQATEKDSIVIKENKLFINNKELINSEGKNYIFTKNEQKIISLFINNEHIGKEEYLVFGDNINNSIDSRRFGVINLNDIIGKFFIETH